MEPDRNITEQVRRNIKQAANEEFQNTKPLSRKISIRCRIAVYSAVAAFSLAVFLIGASKLAGQIGFTDKTVKPPIPSAHAERPLTFRQIAVTDQGAIPYGKITSPAPKGLTDRTVTISGYTENVPFDTPFIWVMVDVPSIGRSWPKKPLIRPNGMFQTVFLEGGPNIDFTVSLYAVGYGLNKTIEDWFAAGTLGGMPMLPQQYKLDSLRLTLNGI